MVLFLLFRFLTPIIILAHHIKPLILQIKVWLIQQYCFTKSSTFNGGEINASGMFASNTYLLMYNSHATAWVLMNPINSPSTETDSNWTPIFDIETPGDLSVSYGAQLGTSIRIGNLVMASFQLICTPTFTTASGLLQINGMTVNGALTPSYFGIVEVSNITFSVGYTQVVCNIQDDLIYIYQNGSSLALARIRIHKYCKVERQ